MPFQAKLTTKLEKYSVGDTVVELDNAVDKEQLNHIVKNLLKQLNDVDESDFKDITFDFLVGNRILQLTINKHLELYSDELNAKAILSEKLVDVEYILSLKSPKPLDAAPHEDWVSCVDANDSFIISGSYDNSIRIFSIKDRKNLVTIQNAHEKPITKVRWLKRTKGDALYFVSSGHDEISILRRFNTKSLKVDEVFVYVGHWRSVNCLDTSEDLIVSGSFDNSLRLWSSSLEETTKDLKVDDGDSAKKKQKVKPRKEIPYKAETRDEIVGLFGHSESVTGVKFLGSYHEYKSVASCSIDRSIRIWDLETNESTRRLLSAKPLLGLDFSSEHNLFIAASCDRYVRAWDARAPDNAPVKSLYTSHSAWVSSVHFGSKANTFLSGGYDNLVKLWDLRSPKACLYDLIGHHDKVLDVNWANPSYVISGSADATLKVFKTE